MSQQTSPTYTPPQPVSVMGANQAYTDAGNYFNSTGNGNLLTAQSTALSNAQSPTFYNSFQPSSFQEALGNQYFSNVWPQENAQLQNQFANSGMNFSPALASTQANAYGNLASSVGQYESGIGQTQATNAINAGLGISPNSVLSPYVTNDLNQSNINTQQQNTYNQALAQQQYQQQYNQYAQNNALASTIGQISPIGGQIYGGATGTSGSAFAGTANTLGSPFSALAMNQAMTQYNSQPGVQSYGASSTNGAPSLSSSYSNGASSGYGTSGTSSGYGSPSGFAQAASMFGSY